MRLVLGLGVVLSVTACNTLASDLRHVCDVEDETDRTADSVTGQSAIKNHIAANVKTERGKEVVAKFFASPTAKEGSAYLRSEAAKVGIQPCKFADSWESPVGWSDRF